MEAASVMEQVLVKSWHERPNFFPLTTIIALGRFTSSSRRVVYHTSDLTSLFFPFVFWSPFGLATLSPPFLCRYPHEHCALWYLTSHCLRLEELSSVCARWLRAETSIWISISYHFQEHDTQSGREPKNPFMSLRVGYASVKHLSGSYFGVENRLPNGGKK